MDCSSHRKLIQSCFAACLLAAGTLAPAQAAVREDFETPQTSWQPGDADLSYRLQGHQRITGDPHSGQGSELIQLTGGNGSYVYFAHDAGTARIVAELSPTVWVKANRPGIQLLARVVLPRTLDPRSGQPVATLIRGSSYSSVGTWQQLRISDTPQLLARQLRVLKVQLGSQVDAREAYLDQLVLNVYGGPGQTAVNIDDLEITGVVPRTDNSQPLRTAAPSSRPAQQTQPLATFPRLAEPPRHLPLEASAPVRAAPGIVERLAVIGGWPADVPNHPVARRTFGLAQRTGVQCGSNHRPAHGSNVGRGPASRHLANWPTPANQRAKPGWRHIAAANRPRLRTRSGMASWQRPGIPRTASHDRPGEATAAGRSPTAAPRWCAAPKKIYSHIVDRLTCYRPPGSLWQPPSI